MTVVQENRETRKRRDVENKQQNGKSKSNCTDNHTKCEWFKQPNLKTEIVRLDKKVRSNY